MTPVTVAVVCEPDTDPAHAPGLMRIGMPGPERRSYYSKGEAASAAICVALESVTRRVARGELRAVDGFTVTVVFVNERGEPRTLPRRRPAAAVAKMRPCDAWEATHVKVGGAVERIVLTRPSLGGLFVTTENGRHVSMWEAQAYYTEVSDGEDS